MRSPLTVTLIILILFVVLIIFSVLKGPVEIKKIIDDDFEEDLSKKDITERIKEIIKKDTNENPSIKINRAIASKDISICDGNEKCETSYVFATAKTDGDCNLLENINLKNKCKERV